MRKTTAAVIVAATLGGATLVAAPAALAEGAARAATSATAASSCPRSGGQPGDFTGKVVRKKLSYSVPGRGTVTVSLMSGYGPGGYQYAWTRLENSRKGDIVSLNVYQGRYREQCGILTLSSGGTHASPAFRTSSSSSVTMAAAAEVRGTSYWYPLVTDSW